MTVPIFLYYTTQRKLLLIVPKAVKSCGKNVRFKSRLTFLYKLFETFSTHINLLKPAGHVMHQQFNIQQLYALPTLYLCVLYLSENK